MGKMTTVTLFLNFTEPTAGKTFINGIDLIKDPLEPKSMSPTCRKMSCCTAISRLGRICPSLPSSATRSTSRKTITTW